MANNLDMPGVSVETVIGQIKEAIHTAKLLDPGDATSIDVQQVDLTLKAFVQVGGGGKLDFRIPIINQEVVLGGSLDRQDTQTVELSFTPAPAVRGPKSRNIKTKLVDAIVGIRHSLAAAQTGVIPLTLDHAAVTLEFVLASENEVSLGIEGKFNTKWSNSIKLTLGPKA